MTASRAGAALRLREARLSDAAEIARVMRASIRRLARGAYTSRQIAAWSSLPALYHAWAMTAGGEEYIVAEEDGTIVGYAARRRGELTAVFVAPSQARSGIGTRLLRRVEDEARRKGVRSLVVRAALGAVPFYETMGYRGSRRTRVPLPGRAFLTAVTMRKTVSRSAPPPRPRARRPAIDAETRSDGIWRR